MATQKNITFFRNLTLISFLTFFIFTINSKTQNYVTTYCGSGSPGFVNGDTSVASFYNPFGICIDSDGNLYLAEMGTNVIRKISTEGEVSTYAGSGIAGYMDGEASIARFKSPANLCIDDTGNIYVSDFENQRIRKISTDGMVTTIAGSSGAGYIDGQALEAKFNYPRGICLDDTGNLYIGDSWNHRIRKISVDGTVSTWAGGGNKIGTGSIGDHVDGNDTSARFYTPCELSIDQYNNIYVADAYNHRIRKIDSDRVVTTVAGSGAIGTEEGGFQDGNAGEAQFKIPTACFVTMNGDIFVGDGENLRIRKIINEETVITFAGTGEPGFSDGPDSVATFNLPRGCVMDYNLNRLYVVDYNNHAIRIIHLALTTGISQPYTHEDQIIVYPNPSKDNFIVNSLNCSVPLLVKVYNSTGNLVFEKQQLNSPTLKLEMKTYPGGVYYLVIKSGNKSYSKKLVKTE